MFDLLLQVMLLVILRVSYLSLSSFARVAVVFLVERCKTVIERRSYVSFINIIKLFDLPVWSFWHCKSKDPVSVTRKFVDCFACCLWFCSGKSSEVRSPSYDCSSSSMLWSSLLLYAMLLVFLGTVNSSSSVTVGGSLSLVAQAIDHFRFNKLTSVFYASVLLLIINFVITLCEVAVDPQGDSQVDPQTTLTKLWRNSLSITGQTH